jgi:hypothetical protein
MRDGLSLVFQPGHKGQRGAVGNISETHLGALQAKMLNQAGANAAAPTRYEYAAILEAGKRCWSFDVAIHKARCLPSKTGC